MQLRFKISLFCQFKCKGSDAKYASKKYMPILPLSFRCNWQWKILLTMTTMKKRITWKRQHGYMEIINNFSKQNTLTTIQWSTTSNDNKNNSGEIIETENIDGFNYDLRTRYSYF